MKIRFLLALIAVALFSASAAFGQDLPEAPSATMWKSASSPVRNNLLSIAEITVPAQSLFLVAVEPRPPVHKVVDGKFILLTALVFGLTVADMELTQHCLHEKTCVELNPTLPLSRWGMYATNTPVNMAVMYFAYRRKKAGKRDWWIAPLIDAGIHGGGIGSNIRFAW